MLKKIAFVICGAFLYAAMVYNVNAKSISSVAPEAALQQFEMVSAVPAIAYPQQSVQPIQPAPKVSDGQGGIRKVSSVQRMDTTEVLTVAQENGSRGAAQYIRRPYAKNVCDEYRTLKDHNNTVKHLEVISTGDLRELFYCDLQEMGGKVKDYEYRRWMQTSPLRFDWSKYNTEKTVTIRTQFWDVRWAYGFDLHKFYRNLEDKFGEKAGAVFSSSGLESIVFIKKEFPAQESKVLRGWSSFAYSEESANINPTMDFIYEVKISSGGRDYSLLLMKYAEYPWYLKSLRTGFADYFRFLTKDIVIAKGTYGFYNPMDSNLPIFATSADALQFWMERISEEKTINLLRENK